MNYHVYILANVTRLVYFEQTVDVKAALAREKQIKGWNRKRKNKLVETINPKWEDLLPVLLAGDSAAGGTDCHTVVRDGSQ